MRMMVMRETLWITHSEGVFGKKRKTKKKPVKLGFLSNFPLQYTNFMGKFCPTECVFPFVVEKGLSLFTTQGAWGGVATGPLPDGHLKKLLLYKTIVCQQP